MYDILNLPRLSVINFYSVRALILDGYACEHIRAVLSLMIDKIVTDLMHGFNTVNGRFKFQINENMVLKFMLLHKQF